MPEIRGRTDEDLRIREVVEVVDRGTDLPLAGLAEGAIGASIGDGKPDSGVGLAPRVAVPSA